MKKAVFQESSKAVTLGTQIFVLIRGGTTGIFYRWYKSPLTGVFPHTPQNVPK